MRSRRSSGTYRICTSADVADEGHGGGYRQARIGAGLALVGAVVFILILDAFRADFEANPIVVTTVLGAAAALFGVEILDALRRNGR